MWMSKLNPLFLPKRALTYCTGASASSREKKVEYKEGVLNGFLCIKIPYSSLPGHPIASACPPRFQAPDWDSHFEWSISLNTTFLGLADRKTTLFVRRLPIHRDRDWLQHRCVERDVVHSCYWYHSATHHLRLYLNIPMQWLIETIHRRRRTHAAAISRPKRLCTTLEREGLTKATIFCWVEQPCLGTRSNYQFNAELSRISFSSSFR